MTEKERKYFAYQMGKSIKYPYSVTVHLKKGEGKIINHIGLMRLSLMIHKTEDCRSNQDERGIEVKCPYCEWRTLLINEGDELYNCNQCLDRAIRNNCG